MRIFFYFRNSIAGVVSLTIDIEVTEVPALEGHVLAGTGPLSGKIV